MRALLEGFLVVVMSVSFGTCVVALRGSRKVRLTLAQRRRLGVVGGLLFALSLTGWNALSASRRAPPAQAP